ncbi:rod shape-determining protein [Candidatus Gromoviella agglomerans]|uniref:rod shape-determining protein n=1 Tax=Candidatus Gromoviella agglomerans TaxID=2806609 RepID=UPI001E44D7F5|nr:rod shape-determining protein [Candidatus Gromoviella agglomerans]UFX98442.1 Rod shape-determining protein MreB [Candidatus Gromoviella agglomerans]
MFKNLFNIFSCDIGIDLGTANTLVYVRGKGIVIDEPSVVALSAHKEKKMVLAVGYEAKSMIGRTPSGIIAVRPMKDGVIADFEVAEKMIEYFMKKSIIKAYGRRIFSKKRVVICIPYGATLVDRRAIQEAVIVAGAKEVFLIEEPMAAAIGAGLDVVEAKGCMVVDIGGGTTEIAVIALGGIVFSQSIKVAGDKMDESITSYIKDKFNLLIGEYSSERIKKEIGCAKILKNEKEDVICVKGRDIFRGIPKEITISQRELSESLKGCINDINSGIRSVLSNISPELAADISENGIVLTGGGSCLKNISIAVSEDTGLSVRVADDPLLCVVNGTGKVIEDMDRLSGVLCSLSI